jgi:6-phosphofructokinase 2
MTPDVVTLTLNPALDVTSAVRLLEPSVKLRCEPERLDPGGGGLNAARTIARLGGRATAVYCSGGDVGHRLQRLLEGDDIVQLVVPTAGETRESFAVLERGTGQQYRFILPGPELDEPEWSRAVALTAETGAGGWVLASGSLPRGVPEDAYARLVRAVRAAGGRLVLDTHGPALQAALREGVHLIKPNWREFAALAGEAELSGDERRALAADLVRQGAAEIVIVTLGARGAAVTTADGHAEIAAPVVPVDSPVGGGDAFAGALTLALARGTSLHDAVCRGVAAAAAAVGTPGTAPPRREDVERIYAEVAAASSSSQVLA